MSTYPTSTLRLGGIKKRLVEATLGGTFIRNVGTLMTGTVLSQVLLIAVSPILTRLYSPDHFGNLALFSGIAAIISIFSTMRYHYAIVIAEDELEERQLADLCFRMSLLIATVSLVAVVTYEIYSRVFGAETKLGWISLLLPLAIVTNGFVATLASWCNRRKAYSAIATGSVSQSVTSSSVNLLAGLLYPSGIGLILGALVSQLTNGLVLGRGLRASHADVSRRESLSHQLFTTPVNSLTTVVRKYSKFPRYDIWTDLANVGSIQIPLVLMVAFYSDAFAGYFLLAQRIVGLPMTFIGSAIGQVFYQRAQELKKDFTALNHLMKTVCRATLLIGLLPTILLICWGDDLFALVFGTPWRDAGIVAQLIAPALLFQFIASPLSVIFWVDQAQEQTMRYCIFLLVARTAAVLIPVGLGWSFYATAGLYGLFGTVLWLGFCLFILGKRRLSLLSFLLEVAAGILFAWAAASSMRFFFQ